MTREALKLALSCIKSSAEYKRGNATFVETAEDIEQALAEPVQEPVAWTVREIELIDGMIQVQMDHAERCDHIGNRTMAEKQKGWDMERVALLQKIRATPPAAQPTPVQEPDELTIAYMSGLYDGKKNAAQRQWVGLTDDERFEVADVSDCFEDVVDAVEAKLKEKNT